MSFNETIKAYFVTSDSALSGDISTAYSYLKDHIQEEFISQIKPSEGFELIGSGSLTKKDVFVLEKFEGDFFEQLQQTKSLIIGPRCLITCLLRCEPIPLGNSPVFTTAMRNLHISASGMSVEEKEKLRVRISWMGGFYFQNFGRSITHLVSNTIKSHKYEHATLNSIPVMHMDWVQRVWDRSSLDSINATDPEFDKYKLPIFFGVNITCSGVDNERKNEIMRLVNENGGTYNRVFRSQYTDIVIIEKNKTNSDKYHAAVRYKKDILLPEWIFESVAKGYALPTKDYQVVSLKVSTPNKPDQSVVDFQISNCTQLSDISRASAQEQNTKHNEMSVSDSIYSTSDETLNAAGYKIVLDAICPKKAKNGGNFLDGCSIYLSGFRREEKEKLHRILNAGGATRYDTVNDKVTHIIVGVLNESDLRVWKREGFLSVMNIVKLDWLQESIRLRQPAGEINFRYPLPASCEINVPSPSSERTLRSMSQRFKQPNIPVKKKLFEMPSNVPTIADELANNSKVINKPITPYFEDDEEDLLAQYSQENEILPPIENQTLKPMDSSKANATAVSNLHSSVAAPQQSSVAFSSMGFENLDFLEGMAIYIEEKHFDEEFYSQMIGECEAAHGNVVQENFRDRVDFAIVSFEKTFNKRLLPVKAKHIITELYIEDCMKQNKLVPINYYHEFIPHTADSQPLQGMIIVISIYSGLERDFIDSLAKLLGAHVNQTLVKKERPLLVCQSAEGSKYEGAIKWNYPVVTSNWLLDCAAKGKKVSYKKYLVGSSPDDFPALTVLRDMTSICNYDMGPSTSAAAAAAAVAQIQKKITLIEPPIVPDITPLRNKRVSELAGTPRTLRSNSSSSSEVDSPRTPSNTNIPAGNPSINFALMNDLLDGIEDDNVRKCLQECIEDLRNNQTPELERMRRQACTPINRKIPTPKGIPDFCTTPAFEKRMLEQFERRWRLPIIKLKPRTPLEEIRKRVLRATCKMYGVEYSGDEESPLQSKIATGERTMENAKPRSIFPNDRLDSPDNNTSFQFEKISFEESSPGMKQISDYLKNCESKRLSSKRKATNVCPQESENLEVDGILDQPYQSERFGGDTEAMVGWRDPTEFPQSRRSKVTTMQFQGTPCFSISCSDENVRNETIAKVHQLHGEVSENLNNFDPKCTHYLIERPNRGEKMLGCISSGKWILSLNYIEECYAKNVFVDEELFEWGNPKAYNLPVLPQEEQIIARAAHRWRKVLADSMEKNAGAFTNFRTILHISERNLESLKNVILAGKGEVIPAQSPFSECNSVLRATHCFVDVKKNPITANDYQLLKDNGVHVLSQMYINAYLMNVKDVSVEKYEIAMKTDS